MLEGRFSCTWTLLATATDSHFLSCRGSELINSIRSLTWRKVKETSQKSLERGQHLGWHDKYRNVGINPRGADRGEMPHFPISPGVQTSQFNGQLPTQAAARQHPPYQH